MWFLVGVVAALAGLDALLRWAGGDAASRDWTAPELRRGTAGSVTPAAREAA